jgi:hypothetical protein
MRDPLGGSPRAGIWEMQLFKLAVQSVWLRALIYLGQRFERLSAGRLESRSGRRSLKRPGVTRVDRQITPPEAAVVRWLLDNSYIPEVSAYTRISTQSLRVVGECTCGCRSIDFSADTAGGSILSDALAVYPDAQEAELILWGRDGQIIALEVVDHTDGTLGRWPELSSLRTWKARGHELAKGDSA